MLEDPDIQVGDIRECHAHFDETKHGELVEIIRECYRSPDYWAIKSMATGEMSQTPYGEDRYIHSRFLKPLVSRPNETYEVCE